MTSNDKPPIIYIQVTPQVGAVMAQSATDDFIKASQDKLKEVAHVIGASLQGLVNEISNSPTPPAEIGLEFGVDVGAEGSVPFITKGSIGANFKISVVWRKAES
jgi:Trypsin-co-occurring domain 1